MSSSLSSKLEWKIVEDIAVPLLLSSASRHTATALPIKNGGTPLARRGPTVLELPKQISRVPTLITNRVYYPNPHFHAEVALREIEVIDTGSEAMYGRHKGSFNGDSASTDPPKRSKQLDDSINRAIFLGANRPQAPIMADCWLTKQAFATEHWRLRKSKGWSGQVEPSNLENNSLSVANLRQRSSAEPLRPWGLLNGLTTITIEP